MAWPKLTTTTEPVDWGAAALLAVRRYCGWHVAPVLTEDMTLDGPGGRALLIPSGQLLGVESLEEDGQVVDLESLEVSKAGVIRRSGGPWTNRLGGIKLTVKHGYDEFDDLRGVVEQIAKRAASTGSGALSESAGPFSVRRGTTGGGGEVVGIPLLATEKETLAPYKITWGV